MKTILFLGHVCLKWVLNVQSPTLQELDNFLSPIQRINRWYFGMLFPFLLFSSTIMRNHEYFWNSEMHLRMHLCKSFHKANWRGISIMSKFNLEMHLRMKKWWVRRCIYVYTINSKFNRWYGDGSLDGVNTLTRTRTFPLPYSFASKLTKPQKNPIDALLPFKLCFPNRDSHCILFVFLHRLSLHSIFSFTT